MPCRREPVCCCYVNLVILTGLLGSLAYLALSMYERYLLQQALNYMKTSLDDMKRVVAGTGQAYDDLHEEIDRLTGETIPRTFLMDEETNYRDDGTYKDSVTQSLFNTLATNEANTGSNLTLDSGNQFKEDIQFKMPPAKELLDVNDKIGLSLSSECTKKCIFLPVGEYCGREDCKNNDIYLEMERLKNDYKESKKHENRPTIGLSNNQRNSIEKTPTDVGSSSNQINSKADRKTYFEEPRTISSTSKRKSTKAKVEKLPVTKLGDKEGQSIWCREAKCNCGSSCQARQKRDAYD